LSKKRFLYLSLLTTLLIQGCEPAADRDAVEPGAHTHGPEGEHAHENLASTTWLDPILAVEQARAIQG